MLRVMGACLPKSLLGVLEPCFPGDVEWAPDFALLVGTAFVLPTKLFLSTLATCLTFPAVSPSSHRGAGWAGHGPGGAEGLCGAQLPAGGEAQQPLNILL